MELQVTGYKLQAILVKATCHLPPKSKCQFMTFRSTASRIPRSLTVASLTRQASFKQNALG
jgi:hypothetical protein